MEKQTTWSGRALRLRRHIADLTQGELAEALGVSDGTVSAWEDDENKREPDESQRKALAKALGCSLAQLQKEPK